MRRKLLAIVALAAVLGLILAGCNGQKKSYSADRYDVAIAVQPDGSLHVTETVVFRFSGGPFTFVYRELRTEKTDGIADIQASMDGQPMSTGPGAPGVEITGGDHRKVQWNFAPTGDATHTFGLSYRVFGVAQPGAGADVLAWGALPVEHDYAIQAARVTLTWPAQAQPLGAPRLIAGQGRVESDSRGATITSQDLHADDELTFEQRFAAGSLMAAAPGWQARQRAANRAAPPYVVVATAILLLGGAWMIVRGRGTPAQTRPRAAYVPETSRPVERAPALAGLLVAVGTQVGWAQALATLFDLGRRGIIDIQQTADHKWSDGAKNYTLRLLGRDQRLAPHEQGLLDLLFRARDGALQTDANLADVRGQMGKRWKVFKEPLLEELRTAGLLDPRLEQARGRMLALALILMGLSLAGFIALAVIYLPRDFWPPLLLPGSVFVLSIVGLVVASIQSPLTPAGAAEAADWRDFQSYLRNVARGKATLSKADAYESNLPYAAAFGLAEPWAKAMARNGTREIPGWFHALANARSDGSAAFVAMVAVHSSVGASGGGAAGGGAAGGGGSGAG